jgi:hypothetical protein
VVIDDYGLLYPGVKEAADNFFRDSPEEQPITLIPEQAFVIKRKRDDRAS